MQKRIVPLSPTVIAQIAAGEVIERPCYVVKELIENALDAGATSISIDISNGGLDKIVVSDNGVGMSPEDIVLAPLSHTTSKITTSEDLRSIHSFGFRGEALASIASVSELEIVSRSGDETVGTCVLYECGIERPVRKQARERGTTVNVSQLFANHPVRKRFLKQPAHEHRAIVNIIHSFILTYPHIAFRYSHNNQLLISIPENQTLKDRFHMLFPSFPVDDIVTIDFHQEPFSLTGLVILPHKRGSKIPMRIIAINNRPVHHRGLDQMIQSVFESRSGSRLGTAILSFHLPPTMVDVNIHPKKKLVQLFEENKLVSLFKEPLGKALATAHIPENEELESCGFVREPLNNTYAGTSLKQSINVGRLFSPAQAQELMIIQNTYIMIPSNEGCMIIDQHAAHERILYETLKSTYEGAEVQIYALPKALYYECGLWEKEIIMSHLSILEYMGFSIVVSPQTNGITLTTIPLLLKDRSPLQIFQESIGELEGSITPSEKSIHKMIASIACRSAIKAGEPISLETARALVAQLFSTPSYHSCPHGRPTTITFSMKELDTKFHRR